MKITDKTKKEYLMASIELLDEGYPFNIVISELIDKVIKDQEAATRNQRGNSVYRVTKSGSQFISNEDFAVIMEHYLVLYDFFDRIINGKQYKQKRPVGKEESFGVFLKEELNENSLIKEKQFLQVKKYIEAFNGIQRVLNKYSEEEYKDVLACQKGNRTVWEIAQVIRCFYLWDPYKERIVKTTSRYHKFQEIAGVNSYSQSNFYRVAKEYLPWISRELELILDKELMNSLRVLALIIECSEKENCWLKLLLNVEENLSGQQLKDKNCVSGFIEKEMEQLK